MTVDVMKTLRYVLKCYLRYMYKESYFFNEIAFIQVIFVHLSSILKSYCDQFY